MVHSNYVVVDYVEGLFHSCVVAVLVVDDWVSLYHWHKPADVEVSAQGPIWVVVVPEQMPWSNQTCFDWKMNKYC